MADGSEASNPYVMTRVDPFGFDHAVSTAGYELGASGC